MTSVRDLLLRHAGATIAVLGGGPSLPEQAARLPAGCIRLSANEHGCLLGHCDYIVALDQTRDDGSPHEAVLRGFRTPIIAPHGWADYTMNAHPQMRFTGQQAVWVAWLLGARLVLLAGMDLYRWGTYFHDPQAVSAARSRPVESHAHGWHRMRDTVPVAVRAMGGPLVDIFGAYDPLEVIQPREPDRAAMLAACAGVMVEILQDCNQQRPGGCYERGQVLELQTSEAHRLLVLGRARIHRERTPHSPC